MRNYLFLFIVWLIGIPLLMSYGYNITGMILFYVPIIYFLYRLAKGIKNIIDKFFINPRRTKEIIERLTNDCKELDELLINYNLSSCSKCSDSNHLLVKVNNEGSSIQIKCETCGKTSWIKPINDNYNKDELIRTFDSYEHLKAYGKNFNLSFYYSDNIQSTEKQSRHISQSVKDKVWNRDGGKCVQCGSNQKLEFDHIIPHSKGGANTYRNIQLLCESCNREKSAKIG